MENNVVVSDYAAMDRILREERKYILGMCKKIQVCMPVSMYVCMHVCMYVCVCVCIYVRLYLIANIFFFK